MCSLSLRHHDVGDAAVNECVLKGISLSMILSEADCAYWVSMAIKNVIGLKM